MMSADTVKDMWQKEEEKAEQMEADYVEELEKNGVNRPVQFNQTS